MLKIKISTIYSMCPIARQSPGGKSIWKNCQFYFNEEIKDCDWWIVLESLPKPEKTNCPPENTVLITGEPQDHKKYPQKYIDQFATILACHDNIKHPNVIPTHPSFPWFIGRRMKADETWEEEHTIDYDKFKQMTDIPKTKLISAISSAKSYTPELKQRLKLVNFLKKNLPELDLYGRRLNFFADKWDVIAPYKYHIVLENSEHKDYWTEKLTDAFLAGAYPFYCGCPNVYGYFPKESLTIINKENPQETLEIIKKTIAQSAFEKNQTALKKARELVLDKYNILAVLSDLVEKNSEQNNLPKKEIEIKPEKTFHTAYYKIRRKLYYKLFIKLKYRFKKLFK